VQRGIRHQDSLKELNLEKNYIYQNANLIENLEINYVMDINIIDGILTENRGRISAISIFSGLVMISKCQISLAYLTTLTNKIIPAIYTENSTTYVDSVLIKGNKEFLTTGILSFNSHLKVINSKIFIHRCGGVLTNIQENNKLCLNKTLLLENTGCGILVKGNGEVLLEDNLIEKNQGVGLKIIDCNNINVIGNKIQENLLNGAELINCEGLIMLNSFYKNKGSGALLETNEGMFSAKMFKNTILENYQNGLVIRGDNNHAKICLNEKIANNFLSGIHVCEKASPRITSNTIFENIHQGILVVSDSYAVIEKNEIYKNIKANIAFGGKLAENSLVIENKLYGSRNEGIFIIEANGGRISKNEIYDNNDGIIMVNCDELELFENNVYNNIRCGILVSDKSNPVLKGNLIHDNQFLGLFIRDKSGGTYQNNELKSNISQLYLSKNCKKILPGIQNNNILEGRIDVQSSCMIF
jgi:F-box protein 11